MNKEFFGSKLNTVLLLILIILMVIAIKIMVKDKEGYLHPFNQDKMEEKTGQSMEDKLPSDLVSFSISPNSKVKGLVTYKGVISGGYFFEANIIVNVLDSNKNVIKNGNAMTKDDWMTAGPVAFEGSIDFTNLLKGPAYIQIHNDNPSGLPENDKFVLVPIIIE